MDNPFSGPFMAVEKTIRQQQDFETPLVKTLLNDLPSLKRLAADEADALDRMTAGAMKKERQLQEASAAVVKPVTHVIKVEVVK